MALLTAATKPSTAMWPATTTWCSTTTASTTTSATASSWSHSTTTSSPVTNCHLGGGSQKHWRLNEMSVMKKCWHECVTSTQQGSDRTGRRRRCLRSFCHDNIQMCKAHCLFSRKCWSIWLPDLLLTIKWTHWWATMYIQRSRWGS